MNYYEELGLSATASAEEIRQAYKSLARLLHPDRQSDEHLRRLAELQMTRLNEILAVLCEPALRARYDATLRVRTGATPSVIENSPLPRAYVKLHPFRAGKVRPSAAAIGWSVILMAAASGFAFVFLYFEHDSGMVVYRSTEDTGRQPPPPQATHPSRVLPVPRPNARNEFNPPIPRRVKPSAPEPEPTLQVAEPAQANPAPPSRIIGSDPPAPSTPTAASAAANPVATPRDPLIGTWLYVKPKTAEGSNETFSYRPEYIEMIIKPGQQGKISGRYKGQFHVPDRPISSEVAFRFEGLAGEGTNAFAWRDDDGASGQIRIKMLSEGVMEVSWYTTRFGNAQKLASGTAVLYRN